ncbi:MAG: hypothetical protein EXS31_08275 [Pedosphaera sp.]|nr:hypothetical protein [Pedosphaera sp.]
MEIVRRLEGVSGFHIFPKRWIVERTLVWLIEARRLVRDYKTATKSSASKIYLTHDPAHAQTSGQRQTVNFQIRVSETSLWMSRLRPFIPNPPSAHRTVLQLDIRNVLPPGPLGPVLASKSV